MRFRQLIAQHIFLRGLYYFSVFVLNLVLARLYKATDSGAINYFINNLAFIILLASFSLESATGYFAAKKEIAENKLAWLSFVIGITGGAAGMLIVYLLPLLHAHLPGTNYLLFSFLFIAGTILTSYYVALFYARYNYFLPNLVLSIINVCTIVVAWIFFGLLHDESKKRIFLYIFFAATLLQGIVLCLIYMFQSSSFGKISLPLRNEYRKIFRYAGMALLCNVVFFLVYRIDYWFVSRYAPAQDLGNYIQVSKLGQVFMLLPVIIAKSIFTKTATGDTAEIRSMLQAISRCMTILYGSVIIVVLIAGKWLFPLLYGETFDLMYIPFLLLAPGIIFLSIISLLTAYYAGRGKVIVNLKGALLALITIITGDALFIPKYGIYAAALVSSTGYICYQWYVMRCFIKEHPDTNASDFFIFKASDFRLFKKIMTT